MYEITFSALQKYFSRRFLCHTLGKPHGYNLIAFQPAQPSIAVVFNSYKLKNEKTQEYHLDRDFRAPRGDFTWPAM